MKLIGSTILLGTLLFAVTPLFAADVAAGKDLFGKKCASCHGSSGEGKEAIAKTFKVELRALGSKEVQSKSDADFKKIIMEGTGKMRPVKDVDAKGADDIVAFMRTLKK
jgi:mono/diheme cytochrome c family protein